MNEVQITVMCIGFGLIICFIIIPAIYIFFIKKDDMTPYEPPYTPKYQQGNQYVPKCPVCGSPSIQKISGVSRAAHGYAFGLFSNTARSQWKCNNCGHKF